MPNSISLHEEAIAWHKQNCFDQAEEKYKAALKFEPNNADILSNLGMLYYHSGKYEEALELIEQAIKISVPKAVYYYRLGLVLVKKGEITNSIRAYQQSIAIDRKWIASYINLGILLFEQGNLTRAEQILGQAIAIDPQRSDSYHYLGKILTQRRRYDEAILAYKKAIQIEPTNSDILYDLATVFQVKNSSEQNQANLYFGDAYFQQNNYETAINYYQSFLESQSKETPILTEDNARAYLNLITSFYHIEQEETAVNWLKKAKEIYGNADEIIIKLLEFLNFSGQVNEGIVVAKEASESLLNNLYFNKINLLKLPILYEYEEEIEFYRQRFTQGLDIIKQQISLETSEDKEKTLLACGLHTNFYLAYQGKDDKELQMKYGQFFQQIMAANFPEFVIPRTMPKLEDNGKIRVGYISNFLYSYHTVTHLFSGWLRYSDREKFTILCYQLGNPSDIETVKLIQENSDGFYQLPHQQILDSNFIKNAAQKIIDDNLHILVFLDIGMHPYMTIFGSLRLAPIQCTTWAHPVTSGLPTIDYFISSDLMEPPEAEKYYSEKLIKLPGIGIAYAKPDITEPVKNRADFQLREDAIVYLCCQSLYKYLPQYDYVFAEIAKRVPQSQFAFISNKNPHVTKQLRQRLKRAFEKIGLNSEEYCVILPQQYQNDYWNLHLIADVFLDPFQWSGGRSTLEAVACKLPIVTCPGKFMRGRHSYAILQQLKVTETIAKNEAEYIEIAVKLGLDKEWRNQIVAQMIQNYPYLYSDRTCVTALEEFYQYSIAL
ncbi:tetratricopeptide repeat protein [Aerosakkonemataceae cyanobacterium BLCC-F154]|uniref:protein O-GlcNAc transferase n=1 Tax=Floridaenema fluviatile BLCC-F154 TaxID=3153640 RepID=A0ABV4YAS8_9CYAN